MTATVIVQGHKVLRGLLTALALISNPAWQKMLAGTGKAGWRLPDLFMESGCRSWSWRRDWPPAVLADRRGILVRVRAIARVTRDELGNIRDELREHATQQKVSQTYAWRFRNEVLMR